MTNFPPWASKIRPLIPLVVGGGALYVTILFWYGASPLTTDVGYAPSQPVPFSHALHNGQLGIDCRYCHTAVEKAAHSNVPTTETCMNCHQRIHTKSPALAPVRESWATNDPVDWVRVHSLPDFVYFNHSAHVTRGVSCVSCHGRVDTMERIAQVERLSMGWCLDCHRAPEKNLRPQEFITKLDWTPTEDPLVLGARLREENHINPPQDCSTCHR
jgi:hypothetical protein